MCGKRAYCWKTMFTGRRFAATCVTSVPPSRTRPLSGVSKPAIMRSDVVLPHPLGPSIEKNSPSRMSNDTSATAEWLPKLLLTLSNAIAMRPGGAIRESNPGLRKRGLQCGERLRPRDPVRDEPLCLLEPLDRALGRRPVRAVDCAGAVADAL